MVSQNNAIFGKSYEKSRIVIFGAPFDGTTSYRPGARFGPGAIRGEFYGLESYSPEQDKDIRDVKTFDYGDLAFPFGNPAKTLGIIEKFVDSLIADGKLPFMLGGEHLVTLGAVRSLLKKHDSLCVIQFDAHADLMDEYIGEKLSHATVMRRIWELVGDKRLYQFGIRSGKRHEFEFAEEHTHIRKFDFEGVDKLADMLANTPVYLSVDLDVLDPSVLPGTGTPEPGGVSFRELLNALLELSPLNIVGCDINELSPAYDTSGVSTAVACKILREMLMII
jgi:agmatinase